MPNTAEAFQAIAAALSARLSFFRNRMGDILALSDTDPDGVRKAKRAVEKAFRYPRIHEDIHNGAWCCDGCGRPLDDKAKTLDNTRLVTAVLAEQVAKAYDRLRLVGIDPHDE